MTKSEKIPSHHKEIGQRIRIVRTYLRLNQEKLAETLSMSQSQLSRIESGFTPPTVQHLRIIRNIANSSKAIHGKLCWEWLIEGSGPMSKPMT